MSVNTGMKTVSYTAGADLSGSQFLFVKIGATASTVILPTATSDQILGVNQSKPKSGEAAAIAIEGRVKVKAHAAISLGAKVSSFSDGTAVTQGGGDPVAGICTRAAGGINELCEIQLDVPSHA